MTAKKICLYLCIGVISIVMLSCSRTVEIDEVNIRNYFSSFPVEAQDIIAEGKFVVKTVSGMPTEVVIVGVSSYEEAIKKHVATFPAPTTIEYLASGHKSSQEVVESVMRGKMYSIDEFRSQFGLEVDDWSGFEVWYTNFPAFSGTRLNGLILTSLKNNIAVYLLFIDSVPGMTEPMREE